MSETELLILFQITALSIRKLLVAVDLLGYFETNVGRIVYKRWETEIFDCSGASRVSA